MSVSVGSKLLFFCALVLSALVVHAQEPPRVSTNFDANWSFHLGDAQGAEKLDYDANSWRKLRLPHDWSIEGENLQSNPGGGTVGFFPTGIGWYRKEFNVGGIKSSDRCQIEFDGVYMNSSVWLNGRQVKMKGVNLHHDAGGVGAAVPLRVWERRLELLKESGCNAIPLRLSPMTSPTLP